MPDAAPALIATRLPGLLETAIDGELVGLHIDNGAAYGFNLTATRVWAMLDTPKSLADICAALVAEFDVDRAACQAQVRVLLEQFRSEGLVSLSAA